MHHVGYYTQQLKCQVLIRKLLDYQGNKIRRIREPEGTCV